MSKSFKDILDGWQASSWEHGSRSSQLSRHNPIIGDTPSQPKNESIKTLVESIQIAQLASVSTNSSSEQNIFTDGIHFKKDTVIGEVILRALSEVISTNGDHKMASDDLTEKLDAIQKASSLHMEHLPPRTENEGYPHFEATYCLPLEILIRAADGLYANESLKPSERGLRLASKFSKTLMDGNPDVVGVTIDSSSEVVVRFIIELKRPEAFPSKLFQSLFHKAKENQVVLRLNNEGVYKLYADEETLDDKLNHLVAQVVLALDRQGSGLVVVSNWDCFMTFRRITASCVHVGKYVCRNGAGTSPSWIREKFGLNNPSGIDLTLNPISLLLGALIVADDKTVLPRYESPGLTASTSRPGSNKRKADGNGGSSRIRRSRPPTPRRDSDTAVNASSMPPPPLPAASSSPQNASPIDRPDLASPAITHDEGQPPSTPPSSASTFRTESTLVHSEDGQNNPVVGLVLVPDLSDLGIDITKAVKPWSMNAYTTWTDMAIDKSTDAAKDASLYLRLVGLTHSETPPRTEKGALGTIVRGRLSEVDGVEIDFTGKTSPKFDEEVAIKVIDFRRFPMAPHPSSPYPCSEVKYSTKYTLEEAICATKREINLYINALVELQGTLVPKFYGAFNASTLGPWNKDPAPAILVLSLVGEEWNGADFDMVRRAYRMLHSKGVIHGDVRRRHVRQSPIITELTNRQSDTCMLIDFERGSYVGFGANGMAAQKLEMQRVERMIEGWADGREEDELYIDDNEGQPRTD